mgnify:FL=1
MSLNLCFVVKVGTRVPRTSQCIVLQAEVSHCAEPANLGRDVSCTTPTYSVNHGGSIGSMTCRSRTRKFVVRKIEIGKLGEITNLRRYAAYGMRATMQMGVGW